MAAVAPATERAAWPQRVGNCPPQQAHTPVEGVERQRARQRDAPGVQPLLPRPLAPRHLLHGAHQRGLDVLRLGGGRAAGCRCACLQACWWLPARCLAKSAASSAETTTPRVQYRVRSPTASRPAPLTHPPPLLPRCLPANSGAETLRADCWPWSWAACGAPSSGRALGLRTWARRCMRPGCRKLTTPPACGTLWGAERASACSILGWERGRFSGRASRASVGRPPSHARALAGRHSGDLPPRHTHWAAPAAGRPARAAVLSLQQARLQECSMHAPPASHAHCGGRAVRRVRRARLASPWLPAKPSQAHRNSDPTLRWHKMTQAALTNGTETHTLYWVWPQPQGHGYSSRFWSGMPRWLGSASALSRA